VPNLGTGLWREKLRRSLLYCARVLRRNLSKICPSYQKLLFPDQLVAFKGHNLANTVLDISIGIRGAECM
jgi:hypothetical protein